MASAASAAARLTKAATTSKQALGPRFEGLLCPTIQHFHECLLSSSSSSHAAGGEAVASKFDLEAHKRRERILGLDGTRSQVSLAISDGSWRTAVPFGMYVKTARAGADAKLIRSALRPLDEEQGVIISGVVMNVRPEMEGIGMEMEMEYLRQLISNDDENENAFPGLKGVVLYSEAHALRHSVRKYIDFKTAVSNIPKKKMEAKRRSRFDSAMNPDLDTSMLVNDADAVNRISASETLQTVLDQLGLLEQQPQGQQQVTT